LRDLGKAPISVGREKCRRGRNGIYPAGMVQLLAHRDYVYTGEPRTKTGSCTQHVRGQRSKKGIIHAGKSAAERIIRESYEQFLANRRVRHRRKDVSGGQRHSIEQKRDRKGAVDVRGIRAAS